jgi:hypothetical protein
MEEVLGQIVSVDDVDLVPTDHAHEMEERERQIGDRHRQAEGDVVPDESGQ